MHTHHLGERFFLIRDIRVGDYLRVPQEKSHYGKASSDGYIYLRATKIEQVSAHSVIVSWTNYIPSKGCYDVEDLIEDPWELYRAGPPIIEEDPI